MRLEVARLFMALIRKILDLAWAVSNLLNSLLDGAQSLCWLNFMI